MDDTITAMNREPYASILSGRVIWTELKSPDTGESTRSRWLRLSGPPEPDWSLRWMHMAMHIASWSKDPRTQVGCVLVRDRRRIAEGYNGFPHGIKDDPTRYNDPEVKHTLVVHAEANAIAHAAEFGVSTRGAAAFVTYPCCPRCATLLIQAGIQAVVTPKGVRVPERYRKDAELGERILREAGVPYIYAPTFDTGSQGEWERVQTQGLVRDVVQVTVPFTPGLAWLTTPEGDVMQRPRPGETLSLYGTTYVVQDWLEHRTFIGRRLTES